MTSPAAAPPALGDPAGADDAAAPGQASSPRIWIHLGLLCLALAAVLALAKPDVSTWDEGSYGSQADILRDGSWYGSYSFDDIDPKGDWYPIIYSTRTDDGYVTYARHPFLPWLQSELGRPLGRAGYLVPSVLGVIGACAATWAIAKRVRPGSEVVAFWVAGSGPLLFHTSIIWAHALGAAFGGLAVLGAVVVRSRRSSWPGHLALIAGCAGALLVRSEGLLFALALLVALGLDALLRRTGTAAGGQADDAAFGTRLKAAVAVTAPAAVAVVLVWVAEQKWIGSIVGPVASPLAVRENTHHYSYLGGRVNGLWNSTLAGSDISSRAPVLLVLLVAVLAVIGLRHRFTRSDLVAPAVGAYALAMLVLQLTARDQFVTGLLPGWPIMSIGVVACGAALWGRQRLLSMAVLFTALAIWATEYPDGGVFQWGGRFFMIIAVPLAVIAAAGLRTLFAEAGRAESKPVHQTPVFVAVVLLGLVTASAQLVGLRSTRENFQNTLGTVEAASGPVAVTTSEEMPRLMWKSDIDWLEVSGDDLGEVLAALRSRGLDEVSVVATEREARASASEFGAITDQTPVPGTALSVWTVEAPPAS